MIVFYVNPNTLKLPYETIIKVESRDKDNQLIYDAKGNVKFINKKEAAYIKFVPGKNTISNDLWVKVVEYNKKNWDYYSTILNVFKGKIDPKTEIVIGENEDEISIDGLSAVEMKELVENTMDEKDIDRYWKAENKRDKPRPSVVKVIKRRKATISEADKAFNKE